MDDEPYGPDGPYSHAHAEIAQEILRRAFAELCGAGLEHVEAWHACIHFGLDHLPVFGLPEDVAGEYGAVTEAIDDRLVALREGSH